MSTATAEQQQVSVEVKVYKPSESLMKLADNIKAVAKFDPGIIPIFEQATRINAVNQLLAAPEMATILDKLEGNPAGFLTDMKGDARYPLKERNMAVTQALSLGARLVNKEFTIIKGNAMLGKNYYQRMLDELGHPGSYTEACKYRMMFWDTEAGDLQTNGPIATCSMTVHYKVYDKVAQKELEERHFTRKFSIRTNSTDTPDLWMGKFERRVWQKLLRYLAGVDFGEDADEGGAAASTASVAPPVGAVSLGKEAAAAAPAPKAGPVSTPAPAATDADFTPVPPPAQAQAAQSAPAPAEPPKAQGKAYADMNPKERAAYVAANGGTPGGQVPPKMDLHLGQATYPNHPTSAMSEAAVKESQAKAAAKAPTPPAAPPPQEPPPNMPSGTPDLF